MKCVSPSEDYGRELRLGDDALDLREQAGVDEGADVEAADAAEEAEVEAAEVDGGEVEVAEDAEPAELREQGHLLQLEQGVEVEDVVAKEALEAAEVQVVEGPQLREGLQVERVDGVEVLQVLVRERELVEGVQVDLAALLNSSGGSAGNSSQGADDHG